MFLFSGRGGVILRAKVLFLGLVKVNLQVGSFESGGLPRAHVASFGWFDGRGYIFLKK